MNSRAVRWLLGTSLAVASWQSADGSIGVRSDWPGVTVGLLALGSGVAVVVPQRRWVLATVAAVGWITMAMWPAMAVASYFGGLELRRRGAQLGFLGGSLVVMGAGVPVALAVGGLRQVTTATPANFAMMWLLLVVLPMVVGLWTRARRDTMAALRERAEQLEREQQARADRARAEERNRIAREMHDVVAHRVSLMVLHAGALEVSAGDERTVEAAALIRSIGRGALTDLREALGALRSTDTGPASRRPQPTLADLDVLLQQSRAVGVPVTRNDVGPARELPPAVERAAYRVVQEALTNVHKHAADADTEVELRYLPDVLQVSIHNGPSNGDGPAMPGAGLGIVGLRERVESLAGSLEAGPAPDGGYTLLARIPVRSA